MINRTMSRTLSPWLNHVRKLHQNLIVPAKFKNIKIETIESRNRMLTVKWNDGSQGRFPLIWLRDNAVDCPGVFHSTRNLKARTLTLADFDLEEEPSSMELSLDGSSVAAEWADGSRASFPAAWLRFRNPDNAETRREREAFYFRPISTWGAEEAVDIFAKAWKWADLATEGAALHDCLLQLASHGLVVVQAPPERGTVTKLIRLLNYAHMSHFQYEWSVDIKPDPINLGYTPRRIGLHTDEPALENPPNVMALHFIVQAGSGGETELADGFHVSKILQEEAPEAFELLSTYPLEFMDEGRDDHFAWDLVASHKVIDLNSAGVQRNCYFSGHQRGWFFGALPTERIPDMYRALKLFNDVAYQPRCLYKQKMKEGEMILIANNRLLHGRTGINPTDSRSVEGCYFDWDVIRSKIRYLRDAMDHPENQPSF